MGFIPTGNSTQLTAYLTQRGRELLLNGTEQDVEINFFALGDSDTNYKIANNLTAGFVPDLSGDNTDCVISLANNVGIKYPIQYNNTVNTGTTNTTNPSQVMFKRTDNGLYYNVLDCLIHLDNIGRYQLYNSSGNLSNPNALKINSALLSPFQDLFTEVALFDGISGNILPYQQMTFEMVFSQNLYGIFNNTYINGATASTVTQSGLGTSPITLTFSSLNTTGGTLSGAGKASIGLYSRQIGYLYKPWSASTINFVPASIFEGSQNYTFFTDLNNNVINQYDDYTLATKITAKDEVDLTIKNWIYRGDKNLTNISDTLMQPLVNESKFANQYAKLFADTTPVVNGVLSNSATAVMAKEILNLKDFIQTSNLFNIVQGTNEYNTNKLTFSVYPQNNTFNVQPATLNIIFTYNEDVLLNGNVDYSHISDSGSGLFIEYDFTPTNGIFKNVTKSAVFNKNNCGTGFQGSAVNYVVSGGTYTGGTQAVADTLAQNDVNANGQNFANTFGTCTATQQFLSVAFSQNVFRNDCSTGYQGSSVLVSFPAGHFTSFISQTDANQQAITAAQQVADNTGTCTIIQSSGAGTGGCLLAGQKIIVDINNSFYVKNIEDVIIGDKVFTFDEQGNNFNSYVIENKFKGLAHKWYKIVTIYNNSLIECSPTHLFMVNGEEKQAQYLNENDKLYYLFEGKELKETDIKSIEIINEEVDIYNIEVKDAHTYFTENLIWHHNKLLPPN